MNAACSLVCYVVGWHLSSATDSMPLARAGAVATTFAIGFALYDFRSALAGSEQRATEVVDKATQSFTITGEASRKRISAKLQRNTALADRFISISQAVILMLATMVWGFGDLAKGFIPA